MFKSLQTNETHSFLFINNIDIVFCGHHINSEVDQKLQKILVDISKNMHLWYPRPHRICITAS